MSSSLSIAEDSGYCTAGAPVFTFNSTSLGQEFYAYLGGNKQEFGFNGGLF